MRKQVEESTAAESARRATRPAAERDRKGRFSARRYTRDGTPPAARRESRVGVAGIGDHGGAGLPMA